MLYCDAPSQQNCLSPCGHGELVVWSFGQFFPSLSERQADGENVDRHGENDIKAACLYVYENGPLCAEIQLVLLQFHCENSFLYLCVHLMAW